MRVIQLLCVQLELIEHVIDHLLGQFRALNLLDVVPAVVLARPFCESGLFVALAQRLCAPLGADVGVAELARPVGLLADLVREREHVNFVQRVRRREVVWRLVGKAILRVDLVERRRERVVRRPRVGDLARAPLVVWHGG